MKEEKAPNIINNHRFMSPKSLTKVAPTPKNRAVNANLDKS